MPILEIRGLTKEFRGGFRRDSVVAVDDVTVTIPGNEPRILSIVGESGSGKTTIARMILRMMEATSGSVTIGDAHLDRQSRRGMGSAQFKRTVQPIFQNPFESFSARRKVAAYLFDTALNLGVAKSRPEARTAVDESLRAVGLRLEYVAGKYAAQFSGGELQRICIARALIPHPMLIVADEPVAMIDASLRMSIIDLFLRLKQEYKISFIYITHDLSTAYYVSDAVAIMYRGSLMEFGQSDDILTSPQHPYTQLLLQSIPQIGVDWDATAADAPGTTRTVSPNGCKFADRCPFVQDVCTTHTPPRVRLEGGREALCFRPAGYRTDVTHLGTVASVPG